MIELTMFIRIPDPVAKITKKHDQRKNAEEDEKIKRKNERSQLKMTRNNI